MYAYFPFNGGSKVTKEHKEPRETFEEKKTSIF